MNRTMGGDCMNSVLKSQYHFHIDCRCIICLALVAIATATIAKPMTNTLHCFTKKVQISQMIQQKLCIQNWTVDVLPLDVKIA